MGKLIFLLMLSTAICICQNQKLTLKDFYGTYLNTDDPKLKTKKEILKQVGWFRLKIDSTIIMLDSDSRFESLFPSKAPEGKLAPGGEYMDQNYNYILKNDTLYLYSTGERGAPKELKTPNRPNYVILYKKDGKLFASKCDYIRDSEDPNIYFEPAREKSGPPFLFQKFDSVTDEDIEKYAIENPWEN